MNTTYTYYTHGQSLLSIQMVMSRLPDVQMTPSVSSTASTGLLKAILFKRAFDLKLEYLPVSFEFSFEFSFPVEFSKNLDSMVEGSAACCVQASLRAIPYKLPVPLTQRGEVLDERAPE